MRPIAGTLNFLREAEALKSTLRSGRTASGRQESTAEHSWRLCLMVVVLGDRLPGIDLLKLLKMCIVHDLGEAIGGDVAAPEQVGAALVDKRRRERDDLEAITAKLDVIPQQEIRSLWNEYEEGTSAEAKLAKAFDKLETIMQHNQGANGEDFDYAFNLEYGRGHTSAHPLTAEIRRLLDLRTQLKLA